LHHTHEGSIGNLCNKEIQAKFQSRLDSFPFGSIAGRLAALLDG